MTTHLVVDSPIGALTLVATDGVLRGLYLPEHARMPDPAGFGPRDPGGFGMVESQLDEYFAGRRTEFTIPLAPVGTPFQRDVWRALIHIPYGQRRSYAEIARAIGAERSARAVGAANGRNPISIIVPCHRVVGSRASSSPALLALGRASSSPALLALGRESLSPALLALGRESSSPALLALGRASLTGYAGGLERKRYLLELESSLSTAGRRSR